MVETFYPLNRSRSQPVIIKTGDGTREDGICCDEDDRNDYSLGWNYIHLDLKVVLKVSIRQDTGNKTTIKFEASTDDISVLLWISSVC